MQKKTDNMTMYQRAEPKLADITDREITEDRLEVLRQADDIMIQEIKTAGLYKEVAQAFAVLPTCQQYRRYGR
jgi:GMP synthase PP-ATPase subunit